MYTGADMGMRRGEGDVWGCVSGRSGDAFMFIWRGVSRDRWCCTFIFERGADTVSLDQGRGENDVGVPIHFQDVS